eukprot:scaffold3990_cov284-Chaetoceros_neogracile.AAC.12
MPQKNFVDVVAAAVARDMLRKELQSRWTKLTSNDALFLKAVVDDEHVTVQNLENADRVLRTDPLYRLDDEDESDEESDDHGVSGAWDLDVNVSIEDNEIETVIDDIMDGHSNNVKATQPNEYSYRTWELMDDYSYPILGMTDDIPSSYRYNLSRDGANLQSLYHYIRQCPRTLLAIETMIFPARIEFFHHLSLTH